MEFDNLSDEVEVLEIEKPDKEEKKEKSPFTLIIIIILIMLVTILGYLFFVQNKVDKKLENKIETASIDYFEKYMSTNDSASTYVVTLDMLINANNNGENYNLTGLEKCNKQSTLSRITINYNNGQPKKVEVELNC